MDHSIANLGPTIRKYRIAAGLNVKGLADETGYSAAYISQLESGATAPSLSALATIAASVGVDISMFFPVPEGPLVRVARVGDLNRLRLAPNTAEEYTILSNYGPGASVTALIHRAYPSEQPPVKFRNVGERFALVLSGTVRFGFAGSVEDLGPGDSVHFASQVPYSMEITSNTPAEILCFVYPAIV